MRRTEEKYLYNDYYCFNKQAFNGRLEKQLGDFGEQLIMTVLGRMKKYKVFRVDHEGADLIAAEVERAEDSNMRRYAISVKAKQFGINESQNYVFDRTNQKKLTKFAEDFNAIPVVAEVLIAKDFSFLDIFLIRLKDFMDLANESSEVAEFLVDEGKLKKDCNGRVRDRNHLYPQLAICWDNDKGLSLNNYVFNGKKKMYESNKYTEYLYNNSRIQHMRISMDSRLDGTSLGGVLENEIDEELLSQSDNKDGNLTRQLGTFGEHMMAFAFAYFKEYKVAIVDHVGIDLIATKPGSEQKPYAISVKTLLKSGISHTYAFEDILKIVDVSDTLNFTPAVAYILPREKGNPEIFDFYFMTLDTLVQYAKKTNMCVNVLLEEEPTINNYIALYLNKKLALELKITNNDYLRNFPGVEHMEMHFQCDLNKNGGDLTCHGNTSSETEP